MTTTYAPVETELTTMTTMNDTTETNGAPMMNKRNPLFYFAANTAIKLAIITVFN